MNREQEKNSFINLLGRLDLNDYNAVMEWLISFAPYTEEPLTPQQREKVVRILNKVNKNIEDLMKSVEDHTKYTKVQDISRILEKASKAIGDEGNISFTNPESIKYGVNNSTVMQDLNAYLSTYKENELKFKDDILERLATLKSVMPANRLDIDDAIRDMEREMIELASEIMISDNTYSTSEETVALMSLIEVQEEKVQKLELDRASISQQDLPPMEEVINKLTELNREAIKAQKELKDRKGGDKEYEEEIKNHLEDITTQRDNLIANFKASNEIQDLFEEMDNFELTVVENWKGQHNEFDLRLNDKAIELKEAIKDYYAKVSSYKNIESEYESAVSELASLNNRLHTITNQNRKTITEDSAKRFSELKSKANTLKVLKEKGITSTQSYLTDLIKDYENDALTTPELNAKLIEMKKNLAPLYGLTEEQRIQELSENTKSKEKIISEISRLEAKLANPESYRIKNVYKPVELTIAEDGTITNPTTDNGNDYYNPPIQDYNIWQANRQYNQYEEKVNALEAKLKEYDGKQASNINSINSLKAKLELERKALIETKREETGLVKALSKYGLTDSDSATKKEELEKKLETLQAELEQKNNTYLALPDVKALEDARKQKSEAEANLEKEQNPEQKAYYAGILEGLNIKIANYESALAPSNVDVASINKQINDIKAELSGVKSKKLSDAQRITKETLEARLQECRKEIDRATAEINRLPQMIAVKEANNEEIEQHQKQDIMLKIEQYKALQEKINKKSRDENKHSKWHKDIDELHLSRLKQDLIPLMHREEYLNQGKDLFAELIEMTGGQKEEVKAETTLSPVEPKKPEEPETKEDKTPLPPVEPKKPEESEEKKFPVRPEGKANYSKSDEATQRKVNNFWKKLGKTAILVIVLAMLGIGAAYVTNKIMESKSTVNTEYNQHPIDPDRPIPVGPRDNINVYENADISDLDKIPQQNTPEGLRIDKEQGGGGTGGSDNGGTINPGGNTGGGSDNGGGDNGGGDNGGGTTDPTTKGSHIADTTTVTDVKGNTVNQVGSIASPFGEYTAQYDNASGKYIVYDKDGKSIGSLDANQDGSLDNKTYFDFSKDYSDKEKAGTAPVQEEEKKEIPVNNPEISQEDKDKAQDIDTADPEVQDQIGKDLDNYEFEIIPVDALSGYVDDSQGMSK